MKLQLPLIFFLISFVSISQENAPKNLKFTKNNGQVTDANSQPRPDVLFSSNTNGMNLFLRNTGISYLIGNYNEIDKGIIEKVNEFKKTKEDDFEVDQFESKLRSQAEYSIHQIDVDFFNSNKNIEVLSKNKCEDYINYYNVSNSDGITNVPLFNSVTYKNVYNGIDIDFYGNNNGFEYDFVVAPKSDVSQIQLLWKGSEGMQLMEDGRLKIKTSLNDIIESIPEAYQIIEGEKVQVNVGYELNKTPNNENWLVSFKIGNYNSNFSLIIDPWVTYYGGSMYDRGNDLYNDSYGNLYVVGVTRSSAGISTPGSFKSVIGNNQEGFITKFSPSGARIWATYLGGSEYDYLQSVTVDKNNFVYVTGYTRSDTGFATVGSHKDTITPATTSGFATDAFLVKFSALGLRVWGTYYGGTAGDYGYEVVTDTSSNVYIVGRTSSTSGIATTGAHQTTLIVSSFGSGSDAFLAKFSSSGNLIWGTYYGGEASEQGYGLGVDKNNNVFIGGSTSSTINIATLGSHQSALGLNTMGNPTTDAFLAKFNTSGTRIWGTYIGGEGYDIGNSLAIDTNDNIYVSGRTSGSVGVGTISSSGSFQTASGGGQDAFLAKFNQSGTRLWSTYYGGSSSDYSYAVAVNKTSNNAMMSGDTYSSNLPVSPCALQTSIIGLENGFIGQFNPDGTIYCSSYFGSQHEEDNKITTFGCYIYITGYSPGGVPVTPGAHQTTLGGSIDGYIAQLYVNTCGISSALKTISLDETENTSICTPCNGEATVSFSSTCLTDTLYTYTWSDGTVVLNSKDTFNTLSNLCPGNYWVELSIANSCYTTRDTMFFTIADSNLVSIDFSFDSVCQGLNTNFTNTSVNEPFGTLHYWSFGDGGISAVENPPHRYIASGNYFVTYIQQYSPTCFDTISKTVIVYPKPISDFSSTINGVEYFSDNLDSICVYLFEDVIFTDYSSVSSGVISNFSWSYDNGYSSDVQNPTYAFIGIKNHAVSLEISTEFGCKDTSQTIIKVCDDFNFSIPNSFTPNGDGLNDYFIHSGFGIDTEKYIFQIFNRWGELLYQTNEHKAWDGKFKGQEVPDGVYVWKMQYKKLKGQEIFEKTGHVTLIRKAKP
ncbi:MAG: SBBP repeat-containing protein [Flavobacteriales bacterium]